MKKDKQEEFNDIESKLNDTSNFEPSGKDYSFFYEGNSPLKTELTMKHLYKTKEGEILEAEIGDDLNASQTFTGTYPKPPQKVFELRQETPELAVEIKADNKMIINFKGQQSETQLTKEQAQELLRFKHPQKKGIEKIDDKMCNKEIQQQIIAEKLNEVIEVVNKLKQ